MAAREARYHVPGALLPWLTIHTSMVCALAGYEPGGRRELTHSDAARSL